VACPTVNPGTAVKVGLIRSGGFNIGPARYVSGSPLPAVPAFDVPVAFPVTAPESVL
jgi:hypothetical protein